MPQRIEPMLATLADQAVQRPGLAVRDQVGRLPGPGGRRRRRGPALDAQPPRRRDVLPAAPDAAAAGSTPERRSSTARSSRSTRTGGPTSACSRSALGGKGAPGPRLPGVRPAVPRRAVAARRPARGPQAAAQERAPAAPAGPLRGPHRRRGRGVPRGRRGAAARGHRRQARRSRYEPGRASTRLAEDQDPAGAGARGRRLDAGEGNARDLGALAVGVYEDGELRFAGKVGSGFTAATRATLLDAARAARPTTRRRSTRRRPRTIVAAGAATSSASPGSGPSSSSAPSSAAGRATGMVRQSAFKGIEAGRDPHDRHPREAGRHGGGGPRGRSRTRSRVTDRDTGPATDPARSPKPMASTKRPTRTTHESRGR